jgi:hypothetical protein
MFVDAVLLCTAMMVLHHQSVSLFVLSLLRVSDSTAVTLSEVAYVPTRYCGHTVFISRRSQLRWLDTVI